MRKLLVISLAALLLVGLAIPATAADYVPFKSTAKTVSVEPAGSCMGIVEDYVGTATHLGKFTLSETLCFWGPPVDGRIRFTVDGIYIAANGDQLWYEVDAFFVLPEGPVQEGGFAFTGGTGRFESATGGGATELLPDGLIQKGTIRYEASDRRN